MNDATLAIMAIRNLCQDAGTIARLDKWLDDHGVGLANSGTAWGDDSKLDDEIRRIKNHSEMIRQLWGQTPLELGESSLNDLLGQLRTQIGGENE